MEKFGQGLLYLVVMVVVVLVLVVVVMVSSSNSRDSGSGGWVVVVSKCIWIELTESMLSVIM